MEAADSAANDSCVYVGFRRRGIRLGDSKFEVLWKPSGNFQLQVNNKKALFIYMVCVNIDFALGKQSQSNAELI